MQLNNFKKLKSYIRRSKRVGRGHASGKGKTAGRGIKGQKAREKVGASFKISQLVRRLPQRRGIGNPPKVSKLLEINLDTLSKKFKENEVVDKAGLIRTGLIKPNEVKAKVKVLGSGEVSVPLTVKVAVTKSAKEKIEKAGGQIEEAVV
jgi:large subunit ribosomal protein L15